MTSERCFIPTCKNNEVNSPNKIFVRIREDLREKWCREANVEYFKVYKQYCCEDHFDPKQDLINYHKHKLMNAVPKLKPTASLRNITRSTDSETRKDCQPDGRKGTSKSKSKKYTKKKQRKTLVEECKNYIVEKCGGDITLHNFPDPKTDADRFRTWLYNIGGDILRLDNQKIVKYRKVCVNHFDIKYRTWGKRLCANAVPTLHLADRGHLSASESNTGSVPTGDAPTGLEPSTSSDTENVSTKPVVQTAVQQLYDEADPSPVLQTKSNVNTEEKTYVPKTFSWEKCSEALPIQEDESHDATEMSMYDDEEPKSIPCDTGQTGESSVYQGFWCNVCDGAITGFRYTCVQCNEFDLCASCETNMAHPQHYVLRVPAPTPVAEIQTVLAAIRRHLMKKLDPIVEPNFQDDISIKSEVKSEAEDDNDDEKQQKEQSSPGHESDSSDSSDTRLQTDEDSDCSEDSSVEQNEPLSMQTASTDENNRDKELITSDASETETHTRDATERDRECCTPKRPPSTVTQHYGNKAHNKRKMLEHRRESRESEKNHNVEQNALNTDDTPTVPAPTSTAKNKIILIKKKHNINLKCNAALAKRLCIRNVLDNETNTTLSRLLREGAVSVPQPAKKAVVPEKVGNSAQPVIMLRCLIERRSNKYTNVDNR